MIIEKKCKNCKYVDGCHTAHFSPNEAEDCPYYTLDAVNDSNNEKEPLADLKQAIEDLFDRNNIKDVHILGLSGYGLELAHKDETYQRTYKLELIFLDQMCELYVHPDFSDSVNARNGYLPRLFKLGYDILSNKIILDKLEFLFTKYNKDTQLLVNKANYNIAEYNENNVSKYELMKFTNADNFDDKGKYRHKDIISKTELELYYGKVIPEDMDPYYFLELKAGCGITDGENEK